MLYHKPLLNLTRTNRYLLSLRTDRLLTVALLQFERVRKKKLSLLWDELLHRGLCDFEFSKSMHKHPAVVVLPSCCSFGIRKPGGFLL